MVPCTEPRIDTNIMTKSNLTIEALKNLKQVGTLVSSSRYLAKKMIKGIPFGQDLNILELGAGDGAITKEILKKLNDNSTLISYENHSSFIPLLQNLNDPRLTIAEQCVSQISTNLPLKSFDAVVSSLPLANFELDFKLDLFKGIKSVLKPGGTFHQYQYSLLDYKLLKKQFDNLEIDVCLFNLPPSLVYTVKI